MCSLIDILVILYFFLEMIVKNSAELSVARVGLLIGMNTFSFLMFLIVSKNRLIRLCFHMAMGSDRRKFIFSL